MIAQRNGRQIGNLLVWSLAGGSIRCTGSVCESFEALRARLVDRSFIRLFEVPKSSDRKSRENEETKNRDSPRPEANRGTGPPRVSEDRFVLRRTSVRDKRSPGSDDFSPRFARKFENGRVREVRAGPRPPTIPPPHPGGPCPPPPPDSSSGCGYSPPCPPRGDICPPASPPSGGDPKPKYPPCPNRPKSKDSNKCPSNRPSPCGSERVPDEPCGPAKCPGSGDPKPKYPPCPDRPKSKDSNECPSNRPLPSGSERVPNKPCGPAKCPDGRDTKSKCPPYPDRPKSKDSSEPPYNGPSSCGSETVLDETWRPAKCPDDGHQKSKFFDKPYGPAKSPDVDDRKKCPPSLSIKENLICGRAEFPMRPMNRGYSCSSRSDKRDSEGEASRCGSKSGDAENAKSRNGAHENLESYADGRVICVKPGRRKKRSNSSSKTCGKKPVFSDDSKTPRRSFSSGWSFVKMLCNKGELRGNTLSTKHPKPGPACGKTAESKECEGTKSRAVKRYRRKMMSSECENDNPDGGKNSKTENDRQKQFDPCGKEKSS